METVRRGAGRAAHAEKTNRHAQRTPLPPRPGKVEDARSAIAEAAEVKPYGKMTAAELREAAEGMGINLPKRATKEQIRVAILQKEGEQARAAKRQKVLNERTGTKPLAAGRKAATATIPQQSPSEVDGTLSTETIVSKLGGSRSDVKAASFMRAADGLGWKLDGTSSKGAHTEVTVTRGSEQIHIGWVDGVFIYDECLYTNAGRGTIKLRNASAAKKRMGMNADEASEEASRIQHRRAASDDTHSKDSPVKRQRPPKFNDGMMDQEILDAVYGRTITFVNRISGVEDREYVPRPEEIRKAANRPKITETKSGRVITFVGGNQASFRTVLIQSIVHVSR